MVNNFKWYFSRAWLHKHVNSLPIQNVPWRLESQSCYTIKAHLACALDSLSSLSHVFNTFFYCFLLHSLKLSTYFYILTRDLPWPLLKPIRSQGSWKATGYLLYFPLPSTSPPHPRLILRATLRDVYYFYSTLLWREWVFKWLSDLFKVIQPANVKGKKFNLNH